MKPFTKRETLGLSIIFMFLLIISVPNFILSVKRARDNTRKGDLGSMVYALNAYQNDMSTFPLASTDGKIVACILPGEKIEVDEMGRLKVNFIPCEWGKDALRDPRNDNIDEAYVKILPDDPQTSQGSKYLYFSDGKHYQLYAGLEASDDDQYNQKVVDRNLLCGNRICNTGRSDSNTPLDKSLEQYENELETKSLKE